MEERIMDLRKEEKELAREVSRYERQASEMMVTDDVTYKEAGEALRHLKTLQKKVTEYWEPMRKSTYAAYKAVTDHKKEMITPLEKAEKIIKKKIGTYLKSLEEERLRKEAEFRRLAQEEAERKLAEAVEAERAGDIVGAEAAIAEAEVMDSMTIHLPTAEKPKVEGVSTKKSWTLEGITVTDPEKVPTEIMGAVIRPVDLKAVLALIKATNGTIQIPGITYEATITTSVRAY